MTPTDEYIGRCDSGRSHAVSLLRYLSLGMWWHVSGTWGIGTVKLFMFGVWWEGERGDDWVGIR